MDGKDRNIKVPITVHMLIIFMIKMRGSYNCYGACVFVHFKAPMQLIAARNSRDIGVQRTRELNVIRLPWLYHIHWAVCIDLK